MDDSASRDAARYLIFACLFNVGIPGQRLVPLRGELQGFVVDSPTDYWKRFNAEEVPVGELRDQEVLHAITEWRSGNDGSPALASRILCEDQWAEKITQFRSLLEGPGEIMRLAEQLFARILDGEGSRRDDGPHPGDRDFPGFIELWRLALWQKGRDLPDYEKWVLLQIEKALEKNLRFCIEIYKHWCGARHRGVLAMLEPDRQKEVRGQMLSLVRDKYSGEPERVVAVLEPGVPYNLTRLIRTFSEGEHGGGGFDAQEWSWFADTLLNALRHDRGIMLPELCVLLSDEIQVPDQTDRGLFARDEVHFREDIAQGLFSGQMAELMQELAVEADMSAYAGSRVGVIIEAVQEFARRWLESHSTSGTP